MNLIQDLNDILKWLLYLIINNICTGKQLLKGKQTQEIQSTNRFLMTDYLFLIKLNFITSLIELLPSDATYC